LRFASTAA